MPYVISTIICPTLYPLLYALIVQGYYFAALHPYFKSSLHQEWAQSIDFDVR